MVAALAQCLARFRIHGDGDLGVDDGRFGCERGMAIKFRLDLGSITDEEEARIGMTRERDRGPRHHDTRSVVAAHRVERYGDWRTHVPPTIPEEFIRLRRRSRLLEPS